MNLPPVGEETFLICMTLAIVVGALIGYCWKEREHAREIESIIRITRRIETARKEGAPKGPPPGTYFDSVNFGAIGYEAGKEPKRYG